MEIKLATYFNRKIAEPVLSYLQQGMSPSKLAMTVAFGFIWGIFPVIGTNTLICIATAFVFKLNQAAIQIVNYAVYPLQLVLMLPLIKLGFWITGSDSTAYALEGIWEELQEDRWAAFETLGEVIWMGIVGWAVFASVMFFIVRFVMEQIFKRLSPG